MVDRLITASTNSKPFSFISHPVPECSCLRHDSGLASMHYSSPAANSPVMSALGVVGRCPAWMQSNLTLQSKEKENEDDFDEDNSTSSGLFFQPNGGNNEDRGGESNNKEENQLDDQDELDGGER